MKTRLLCFLMVLALLPCLALAEDAPQKLVVAEPVHLIAYLPLYVAIHEGYFADEGLDVTVVQATGGAHVTAVVSGDAFAVIGGVDSNNFANQGNADPIVAIVNCVNRANVYLFARAGLSPASDSDEDMADFLRGKIIIAGRYGGSPNVLTRYLVKRIGLDPDTDVTLLENADAATVTAMLQIRTGRHWQRRRTADFRGRDGGYLRGAIRRLPRFGGLRLFGHRREALDDGAAA